MKTITNIPYTTANRYRQMLDLYLPEGNEFPVFVFFHGGGLEGGSKEGYTFIQELIEKGIAVICANYRLYPEASFPDYICDAAEAVAWVKNNINTYGKMTQLFIGGSSAGGYLTQMLCFDRRYLAKHHIDADSIDGYFMDAGQPTSHFNILREIGIDTRRIVVDETAPLFFIEQNRNYPPIKIIVSDRDIPNRLEQTALLISTLKHFGHNMDIVDFELVENSTHTEYLKKIEAGKSVYAGMIYGFIQKYVKNPHRHQV